MLNIDKIKSDSIPLGSYVHDDFNEKDPARYKPTDASSINRVDVDPWLLAKLLKNVTSLTPGTDRVDIVGHELEDGQKVKFGFTGGGITALTEYYVRNKTTDDFQLSTTPSGGILDLTSDQTGEMLTNVAWGFGNGSTTLNTPDTTTNADGFVYGHTSQTFTQYVTKLKYDTLGEDPSGAYNLATGELTIPEDGDYMLNWELPYQSYTSIRWRVYIDNAISNYGFVWQASAHSNKTLVIKNLKAGQNIDLRSIVNGVTSSTYSADPVVSFSWKNLSIDHIGKYKVRIA